ncbi:hypothetical protein NIES4106_19960 [Fischerella sp. NIES-4106]|jgi:hypothetical protein|nr:hypothetical protein NIES4106_19960 [Fischerella sp. NIES-4106]
MAGGSTLGNFCLLDEFNYSVVTLTRDDKLIDE